MKRLFIIVGLLAVLLLPLASLSCSDGNVTATLGKEFTLPVGKTVNIESENLVILFDKVLTDSRCPAGQECLWIGEARCQLLITYEGASTKKIITQPGSYNGSDSFLQYNLSFKLEPYPEINKKITPADYKLVMTITKQ
jgi:hypothetical protein